MKKKTLCIYHSLDLDGSASRDVVKRYSEEHGWDTKFVGWNYGDKIPEYEIEHSQRVIIVDLGLPKETMQILFDRGNVDNDFELIWIDHHKSGIDESHELGYHMIKGIRKIGVAACELAYEYFFKEKAPKAIKLLSTYDVWNKTRFDWDKETLPFQYGMRRYHNEIPSILLYPNNTQADNIIDMITSNGEAILEYISNKNKKECSLFSFRANVEEMNVICINSLEFSSNVFNSVWDPKMYDAMLCFADTGTQIKCSLYTTHDIDVSEVARRFGGGGHKQAAGFQISYDQYWRFRERNILYPEVIHEHYRGGDYRVLVADATNQETHEGCVIYRMLKDNSIHTRGLKNFTEIVSYGGQKVSRFKVKE